MLLSGLVESGTARTVRRSVLESERERLLLQFQRPSRIGVDRLKLVLRLLANRLSSCWTLPTGGTGEGNYFYGYDSDYGIGGYAHMVGMARYVAVAQRDVSTSLQNLDFES